MNRTILLLGHSDISGQEVSTSERVPGGTKVTTDLAGVLPILPWAQSDKTLAEKCVPILVTEDTQLPDPNPRLNLFNLVGDADSSSTSLHLIQKIVNAAQPRRCFNLPAHVFRTSRARLPKTLANIPGCIIPKVLSINPKTPEELESACVEFNSWPLIARARGYHGGEHMIMLKDMAEIELVKHQEWLYTGIFLIEFVDYKNGDGLYQKTRVIMIDGFPFLRHSIYGDRWAVHSRNRADLMDGDMELCHREERFLAEFRDVGLREYTQVFQNIHGRIGLDVFGIDLALVNGNIVVFEANACMSFVGQRHGTDEQYGYLDSHLTAIRRALKKMLIMS
jgi:hypothetical protein